MVSGMYGKKYYAVKHPFTCIGTFPKTTEFTQ